MFSREIILGQEINCESLSLCKWKQKEGKQGNSENLFNSKGRRKMKIKWKWDERRRNVWNKYLKRGGRGRETRTNSNVG